METILLVEVDPSESCKLASGLAREFRVVFCHELGRASEAARNYNPAAIVLSLPRAYEPKEVLIRKIACDVKDAPLIVLSAASEPELVVGCLRSGASDFFAKPCDPEALVRALELAVVPGLRPGRREGPFIGDSPAIKAVEDLVRRYAESPYPVLISGESGTGKEIAARALRDLSSRRGGPFVARNCAAIPEHLAESELFGTERGAFTDAVSRPGAFELARTGLLFLDEIGEASLAVQAKLLRALETGEFWRLGGKKSVDADFRFVSATCRDLESAASEGRFRLDLLYRINTLVIRMPPLRSRPEDIAALAGHFVLLASRGRVCVGSSAIEKLVGFSWPGNIRQLRNIVHRALVLAGGSDELRAEHIEF
jgi:DNA-binding NtrC family response regulator